jgi:hypothetical protein
LRGPHQAAGACLTGQWLLKALLLHQLLLQVLMLMLQGWLLQVLSV